MRASKSHLVSWPQSTLWPLFHYFPTLARYEEAYWQEYRHVNRVFGEAVAKALHEPKSRFGPLPFESDFLILLSELTTVGTYRRYFKTVSGCNHSLFTAGNAADIFGIML